MIDTNILTYFSCNCSTFLLGSVENERFLWNCFVDSNFVSTFAAIKLHNSPSRGTASRYDFDSINSK